MNLGVNSKAINIVKWWDSLQILKVVKLIKFTVKLYVDCERKIKFKDVSKV